MRPSERLRRRHLPWIVMATGVLFVAAAGAWQLHASLWMHHYRQVGGSLVQQEASRIAAAQSAATTPGSPGSSTVQLTNSSNTQLVAAASCNEHAASGPQALLQLPSIGVIAPIEQGSGDPVLAVAVGHDPYSVWPGTNGTAVLLSHDVTYFVNISHLKLGQLATYVTPCASYTYKVTGSKIVTAGTAIYNSPYSTIALITCWPTNALFYTTQRYVVSLSLVKATPIKQARPIVIDTGNVPTADAKQPTVPVPSALAAQGLTLATNYAPMGVLTILGKANAAYVQSPAVLLAQDAALVAYFGALKALAEHHTDWWKSFAPGVTPPTALIGEHITSYPSPLNVYIEAHGNSISGVLLRTTAIVGGRSHAIQVATAISSKNALTITSWSM